MAATPHLTTWPAIGRMWCETCGYGSSSGRLELSKKAPTGPTERIPNPVYFDSSSNLGRGPLARSYSIFPGNWTSAPKNLGHISRLGHCWISLLVVFLGPRYCWLGGFFEFAG